MVRIEFEKASCAVCGGLASIPLFSDLKDRCFPRPESFTLVRCNECGHIYQDPKPTLASLPLCYPTNYEPYHKLQHPIAAMLKRWVLQREVRECVRHAVPPAGVLELGCAAGDFLELLKARGYSAKGVEFDLETAKSGCSQGRDIFGGTLLEAELGSETFDIVYTKHVIEHLSNVPETLLEIHRVLKPSGWLLVGTPNIDCSLVRYFGKDTFDLEVPRHLNIYSPSSLTRQLANAGFEVKSIQQDPVPNSWIHSFQLRYEKSRLARAFFRVENPVALLMLSPLSLFLACIRRSSRMRVWAQRR